MFIVVASCLCIRGQARQSTFRLENSGATTKSLHHINQTNYKQITTA
ncbi:hypothetical protein LOT_0835 [Lentilactobacillus otakiensis DSM 19908 = JCM 15040]|uniref:Uncharacterized protein n=1 Tax=Lentilactobacillus otakiensis DSM 19908 = JCM 15040 TaxID=1423780 RepID=S4NGC4_9LACO|nr:hypothetical protein LOT_0835 [Lentilactobacillus otakiensis DSM 19908 = JCM 15040]